MGSLLRKAKRKGEQQRIQDVKWIRAEVRHLPDMVEKESNKKVNHVENMLKLYKSGGMKEVKLYVASCHQAMKEFAEKYKEENQ